MGRTIWAEKRLLLMAALLAAAIGWAHRGGDGRRGPTASPPETGSGLADHFSWDLRVLAFGVRPATHKLDPEPFE